MLNTSVVGTVANSSLPSIEVMPPSNSSTAAYSSLLMSLEVSCPNLLPFNRRHCLALIAAATQVSQSVTFHYAMSSFYGITKRALSVNTIINCPSLLPLYCQHSLALTAAATQVCTLMCCRLLVYYVCKEKGHCIHICY